MKRIPDADEIIICPNSRHHTKYPPRECWDSNDPHGKKITYGVIGKHSHGWGSPECEYVGHVVPVEKLKREQ